MLNDFSFIAKIISERNTILFKEKTLLSKILHKIMKLNEEDRLHLGPKIKIFAILWKASFVEAPYTNNSKLLKEVYDTFEKDLKSRVDEMNESQILTILK